MKSETVRQNLRQELASARLQTDQLFQMLAPAALHMRPIPERHRIVFYLGHLETFDWNMVCKWAFEMSPFNAEFDRLFAFGIDPVDGKLPDDKASDWPELDEICSYRDRIRRTIDAVLDTADLEDESRARIFHVVIEHRFMHAETLAYMLHWLDFDMKTSPESRREESEKKTSTRIRSKTIPSGHVTLGQKANGAFGWDNEFKAHSVLVPEFSIDTFNVTNQDYLDFVTAGGYQERSLWTDDAWNWLQQSDIGHPKFWIRRSADWLYRTMFNEIPLPLDWPVYVSYAEASAYCRWNGKTLPTEEQYQRAAFGSRDGRDSERLPDGNFDSKSWNPMPVGSFAPSAFGVFDLVGNGWEWTRTPFGPFKGFEPFPFYPGYSADFFDGKHFVLKGASPRTAASLVRSSFRNWFQPHYPNVYATFRCVEQ
jgi:ergothioneine biosynthesis protein EgtB